MISAFVYSEVLETTPTETLVIPSGEILHLRLITLRVVFSVAGSLISTV